MFLCILFINSFAQDSSTTTAVNPVSASTVSNQSFSPKDVYKISWAADAPITGGGIGLSFLGLHLIKTKDDLDSLQAAAKNRNDVPSFDRSNAGFYSQKDNDASYVPFFTSFATPVVVMLINKNERQQAGKILVMYTEALAITSSMYTLSAGLIDRSRPLVYGGEEVPLEKKLSNNSQRSFYAGHVAASACATFYAAKVYSDLHPDSKFRTYLWIVSAAVPAVTAYYRYQAGQHFLSDCVLGYALGASTGILVPQLHKIKNFDRVTIYPATWPKAKGLGVAYRF